MYHRTSSPRLCSKIKLPCHATSRGNNSRGMYTYLIIIIVCITKTVVVTEVVRRNCRTDITR